MAELEEILKALSDVQDRLSALPDDAFADRYRLRERRDELRALAREFSRDWDAERPTGDLLAELRSLRSRLAQIERGRIDLVQQAGGGGREGPGASGLGGIDLNAAIDRAQGAGDVKARIGRIEGILIDRGMELPG